MDESARVTGPVEGLPGIIMAGFDLRQVGYTLEEFFLEGSATSFEPTGPAGADGHWQVMPSGRAATVRAVADGFALAEDAGEMVAVAAAGYPARVP